MSDFNNDDIGMVSQIVGPDMLAWLWYKSEVEQPVAGQGLVLGDKLVLENKETKEKVSITGEAADMTEGRIALRKGLRVYSAQFEVSLDGEEHRFTLNGLTGIVSGLKMPKGQPAEDGDDPDAAVLDKIYMINRFLEWLDKAYKEYASVRLGPWGKETAAMATWLEKKK